MIRRCICDKCGKEFKIKRIKKKLFRDGEDKVFFEYFECPKCRAKYISHVSNEEIKSIVREIKALHSKKMDLLKHHRGDQRELDYHLEQIEEQSASSKRKVLTIQSELKAKFSVE
ncbi:hypothetical protein [Halalkalibacterium halodurans]|uniref:hypothetical protein n=1 Tax=Halalkalibacterium halodurans TaxID=86665 RepID=UPI002AAA5A4C|nr:hypothetical protein [Halalkalibacterium halodurans]MDY7224650.1 hypothetical protein [Halalkalibacterium halodurans]MDY7243243.1 hypothetical protein [Halalkalibacterium halodurans]